MVQMCGLGMLRIIRFWCITSISDAVCCRDDIMVYLIKMGLPKNTSFKIMETVRKGKALRTQKSGQYEDLMRKIMSLSGILILVRRLNICFLKHAAAYVMMALELPGLKFIYLWRITQHISP